MKLLVPRNPATKRFAGRWYISEGVPTCSILPALMTTIVSLMVSASD